MATRGGPKTAEAIRQAAIDSFFLHGYEATTLRDLAGEVGVKVGSLYNHISSKEELLFSIMSEVLRDLQAELDRALEGWTAPSERLRVAIECHIAFHAHRAKEVFIGNSELRSLAPDRRAVIIELRDAYEHQVRTIVEEGQASGEFYYPEPRLATFAIVAIGTHVSSWYRPDGSLSLAEVASAYADLLLRAMHNPEVQVAPGDVLAAVEADNAPDAPEAAPAG
ncbi:MAG TPA: TetR/AcrR family transcriptional regulator [Baekduia sp.]|nr:TetR/AcrR family transcriptional regulator [Baekduia sp.]